MERRPEQTFARMGRRFFLTGASGAAIGWILGRPRRGLGRRAMKRSYPIQKSDQEWRRALTPEQYRVTRQGGTEPAFSGKYHDFKGDGVYRCVCCGNELFRSEEKFDSGTGWPSFWAPVSEESIQTASDRRMLMARTEVLCSRCGAHLGHMFEDGPPPTGLRYCINSAALDFEPVHRPSHQ